VVGYVENDRADGSVHIEAEGEEKYNKSKKLREEQAQALKKKFDENADKWVEQIVGDVLA
jgi:acylphosphatase